MGKGARNKPTRGYRGPKDSIFSVELSKPIKAYGTDVSELHFREPEFGDLLDAGDIKNEPRLIAVMIQNCACIPYESVRALSLADLAKVSDALGPFLPGGDEPEEEDSNSSE